MGRLGRCGARTPACRVDTHVDTFSPIRVCAGPRVFLRPCYESGSYWIVVDVSGDFDKFLRAANPVVVRLFLPEWFSGSMQETVRFAREGTFQRFQGLCGVNVKEQKRMNVICHDHEGSEPVMSQ